MGGGVVTADDKRTNTRQRMAEEAHISSGFARRWDLLSGFLLLPEKVGSHLGNAYIFIGVHISSCNYCLGHGSKVNFGGSGEPMG